MEKAESFPPDSQNKRQKLDKEANEDNLHVMLDLETLGLRPTSAIATIGAQPFNIKTGQYDETCYFYNRIDLSSCEKLGMTLDVSTIQWWLDPSRDVGAVKEVFGIGDFRFTIKDALSAFDEWFRRGNFKYVWAKGPDFDCVLLKTAYDKVGVGPLPWAYSNQRDVRTIRHLAQLVHPDGCQTTPVPVKHHALADCREQIREVVASFRVLRNAKTL